MSRIVNQFDQGVETHLAVIRPYLTRHWLKHNKSVFMEDSDAVSLFGEPTEDNIDFLPYPGMIRDNYVSMHINGKGYSSFSLIMAYNMAFEQLREEREEIRLKRGQHALNLVYKPVIINPNNNMPKEAFEAVMALVTHAAALEEELARARAALSDSSKAINDLSNGKYFGNAGDPVWQFAYKAYSLAQGVIQRIDAWIGVDK